MTDIDLESCIQSLTPGAMYSLANNGLNYSDIIWNDTNYTQPTETEINNKKTELLSQLPMDILRSERDTLLQRTDIYVLSDFPHATESVRQLWLTYRQNLRDLPANNPNPSINSNLELTNVTFPVDPNGNQRI